MTHTSLKMLYYGQSYLVANHTTHNDPASYMECSSPEYASTSIYTSSSSSPVPSHWSGSSTALGNFLAEELRSIRDEGQQQQQNPQHPQQQQHGVTGAQLVPSGPSSPEGSLARKTSSAGSSSPASADRRHSVPSEPWTTSAATQCCSSCGALHPSHQSCGPRLSPEPKPAALSAWQLERNQRLHRLHARSERYHKWRNGPSRSQPAAHQPTTGQPGQRGLQYSGPAAPATNSTAAAAAAAPTARNQQSQRPAVQPSTTSRNRQNQKVNPECDSCTNVPCDACWKNIDVVSRANTLLQLARHSDQCSRSDWSPEPGSKGSQERLGEHEEPVNYCWTCSRKYCNNCERTEHNSHERDSVANALDVAREQTARVRRELESAVAACELELASTMSGILHFDRRADLAKNKFLAFVGKARAAGAASQPGLELAANGLLKSMTNDWMARMLEMESRSHLLRKYIEQLSAALRRLAEPDFASEPSANPLELLIANDLLSAHVFLVAKCLQRMPDIDFTRVFSYVKPHPKDKSGDLGRFVIGGCARDPTTESNSNGLLGAGSPCKASSRIECGPRQPPKGRPVPGYLPSIILQWDKKDVVQTMEGIALANQLCRPWGAACDRVGNIVVADRSNHRIVVFAENGMPIGKFGCHGSGAGQFDKPAGVVVDSRQRIIVVDKDNHRVQVFTMKGTFLFAFGEKGCRSGQFNYPWDVAVNDECQIAVSDSRNRRVQLFSAEGVFLRKFGQERKPDGSMNNFLDMPRGIAFSPEGNVIVTDFNNHRIIEIDYDFMEARYIGKDKNGNCARVTRPQGVIVDDCGNIIVSSSYDHKIHVLPKEDQKIWELTGVTLMSKPSGINLTPEGKILIVDSGNNRVLRI